MEVKPQEPLKAKKRHRFYIPWYFREEDDLGEEGEDSWVSYLRRNIAHSAGHDCPFADSSWSYTRNDSPFEQDQREDKKSDETIRDEVFAALYSSDDVDASHVVVVVLNGVVCLMGTVDSEFSKRQATKVVEKLPGVWGVRNELEIDNKT